MEGQVFSSRLLGFIAKSLAILTIVSAVVVLIAGFFVAAEEGGPTAGEQVGYFIGFELVGFASLGFLYLVLGTIYRWNQALDRGATQLQNE